MAQANPYHIKIVKFRDHTGHARKRIEAISDRALNGLCDDAVKLIKQMIRDRMAVSLRSTGRLERSVKKVRYGVMNYDIATVGARHGAPIEYGWHPRRKTGTGRKVKGMLFIVRGFFGMAKRWMQGERWRD